VDNVIDFYICVPLYDSVVPFWLIGNIVNLEYLIPIMIDDLDGNLAGIRAVEGAARGSVKLFPCFLVDLGLEGLTQPFIGLVRAGEIGVADKEALSVVIGVDKPTGDVTGRYGSRFCPPDRYSLPGDLR